jgi:hypothetical protein
MAKKAASASSTSFSAMLGQTVVPNTDGAKGKEALLVIKLDKDNTKNLKEFLEKKKAMKTAEGEMRIAEQPILSTCIDKMHADGLAGHFNHSYKLIGDDNKTAATFCSVDKFNLSQETENVNAIKNCLTPEVYKEEAKETPTVTLRSIVYEDESLQKELAEIMGDKFVKFFETKIRYSLKSGFNERIYKIAKTEVKLKEIEALVGQNKPFIK